MKKAVVFLALMLMGFFMQSHHTHAAGVTTIGINEKYHNVGEEGPGWHFPEAGKLVLTDANLVSISNNKGNISDTLNIVLEGTNTLQQIFYSPNATLTISGSGLLKMTEPEFELNNTMSSFIEVKQGPLRLKDSAKIDIAYAGNTKDSYRAILVRHLYVDDNASLSVVLTDVHAKTLGIHIFNSFQFNTTGKVLSKVTFSSDASKYVKEDTRALLTSNLSPSEAIFAGSGSYEFQVDGGEQAVRFEKGGTQTFTFNNDQEIVTPVGGGLIVDGDETMIVDADNSPLVPHVKIARKFSLDAVNLGPMGAGTLDVMPDEEIFISGEQATISFTANDGYVIDRARRNGMEIVAARNLVQYTLTETMTEDVTFDVIFKVAPMMYSITLNCGENGTCSKNPDQPRYVAGYEVTVGAVANPGYVIDTFSLNPAATGQSSYYMAVNMTNNWTVDVSFKPAPTYSVAFSVCDSAKGTCIVDPEDTAYIQGSKIDLEVTPKPGFEIDTVTINDVPQTITDHQFWVKSTVFVTEDLDLKATFKPAPSFTVSIDETENGSIAADKTTAKIGETVTLTVTPAEGFRLKADTLKVMKGSVRVPVADNAFIMPDGNVTVSAIFEGILYDAMFMQCDPNKGSCSMDPSKPFYYEGETVNVQVVPKDGFEIDKITINTQEQTLNSRLRWTYTTTVTENTYFEAHFRERVQYTVHSAPSANGTITVDKTTAAEGEKITINVRPNSGYALQPNTLKVIANGTTEVPLVGNQFTMPAGNVVIHGAFISVSAPIHRFYSEQFQAHFYTISEDEKNHIIATYPPHTWNYEGIAYNAYPHQQGETSPIYRFYSLTNKKHFYTISEDEKNRLIGGMYPEAQFQYEGVAWYASQNPASHTRPLHRFYSQNSAVHFYTASEEEKNYLIATYPSHIWYYEGVAWHALQ